MMQAVKRATLELTRSLLRVNFNLPAGRNPPPAESPAAFLWVKRFDGFYGFDGLTDNSRATQARVS